MERKIYVVVNDLYENAWGGQFYIVFASEDKTKCIKWVKRYIKPLVIQPEDYVQEIILDKTQQVYVGGYIE